MRATIAMKAADWESSTINQPARPPPPHGTLHHLISYARSQAIVSALRQRRLPSHKPSSLAGGNCCHSAGLRRISSGVQFIGQKTTHVTIEVRMTVPVGRPL